MLHLSALLALLAATSTQSLPLNINLGAYSPALVVGDGEISFGGEADVSNLMTALSGASQGTEAAAAGAGITRAGIEGTVAEKGPSVVAPSLSSAVSVAASSTATPGATVLQGQGIGRDVIEPREPEADTDIVSVEKRDVEDEKRDATDEKRDLAGFNAALAFATGALATGPEVQLGTGEGGSGVGIIVTPATAGTAEKVGKREEGSLPTVTMIKLRTVGDSRGEPTFLEGFLMLN